MVQILLVVVTIRIINITEIGIIETTKNNNNDHVYQNNHNSKNRQNEEYQE